MATVTWKINNASGTVTADVGAGLMEVLRATGMTVDFPCGGNHTCGKCRVLARGQLSTMGEEERALLKDAPAGTRLACFARVAGDCAIEAETRGSDAISTDFMQGHGSLRPIYGEGYGAAFDIGTTTIAAYLFTHDGAEPIAVHGEMNRQRQYGADVLTRIEHTVSNTVEPLRRAVTEQLSDMLLALCQKAHVAPEEVRGACVTGNTTMLHMAVGLDPFSLSQAPFLPQSTFGETANLRLPAFPNLTVYLPRCISAYVGADITCSILASGMCRRPGNLLLVDVGTNGEMALKTGEGLYCCATAAGPAFEGAGISCGSSASEGAISRVWLEGEKLHMEVIGGGAAKSICGSGLVDAMACILDLGWADYRGRIPREREGVLPLGGQVSITLRDVRQLQMAKGAIRGGMDTLLHEAGLEYGDLDEIILCGGFGSFLNPASAERIGLIPPATAEKTTAIGNAAGTGAGWLLQSRDLLEEAEAIVNAAQVVELSTNAFFKDRYIKTMNFPKEE